MQETITRKTYSAGGQAIATRVSGDPNADNNGLFYFHSDHLGSATFLTHGNGHANEGNKVANSTKFYTPFGEYRIQPTSPTDDITDRGFTGHKHNDYIKLIYMNARWYLPGLGRFVSADTIIPNPANPQSFNRYTYVLNSPLNLIDPTGHGEECPDPEACESSPDPTTQPSATEPVLPSETTPIVDFDGFDANDPYQAAVMAAILDAANLVGEAFAQALNSQFGWDLTAEQAFLLVYDGTVTFTWMGVAGPVDNEAAFTKDSNNILIYTREVTNKTEWIIHELGHAFSQRLGGKPVTATDAFLRVRPNVGRPRDGAVLPNVLYGFAGSISSPRKWQHSLYVTPSEQFADMFVGWVYGEWEPGGSPGGWSTSGYAMSTFMNTQMPEWISSAVYK